MFTPWKTGWGRSGRRSSREGWGRRDSEEGGGGGGGGGKRFLFGKWIAKRRLFNLLLYGLSSVTAV